MSANVAMSFKNRDKIAYFHKKSRSVVSFWGRINP